MSNPTPQAPTLTAPAVVRPKPIIDGTNKNNHGILFMRQSDLQAIYKQSGPNAVGNEFQVHYWFINYRFIAEDGSMLDIAVPTTYFNYPQTVNTAHIDFEMNDVNAVSEKAEQLHNFVYQPLLTSHFQQAIEQLLNVKFEVLSVKLGTIHRHPGSSSAQGFSGTDLMKNPEGHGIVFPFDTAHEIPSFSGIMAVDSDGVNRLARMEYRIANGTLGTDIVYEHGRCQAIVLNDLQTTKGSIVEQLLEGEVQTFYAKSDTGKVTNELLESLASIYESILPDFQPSTLLINPDNVTKCATTSYSFPGWNTHKASKATTTPAPTDSVTIKTLAELEAMSKRELVKHAIAIDAILFPNLDATSEYYTDTKKGLIASIIDLQLDLASYRAKQADEEVKPSEDIASTLTSEVVSMPVGVLRAMTMTELKGHANAINKELDNPIKDYITYSYLQLIDEIEFLQLELEDKQKPTPTSKPVDTLLDFKRKELVSIGYSEMLVNGYPEVTVNALYTQYFSK